MLNREIFILFLTHAVGAVAGYFIGRYFKKKSETDWKEKYEATREELTQVKREYKAEKKQIKRLGQERDSWKTDFEKLTKAHDTQTAEFATANLNLTTKKEAHRKLQIESDRLKNQFENLEKAHIKLKERYDTDMHDSKNWKSKRAELVRDIETYKSKWTRAEQEKVKAQHRLTDYIKQVDEFELLKKTHRALSLTHKKTKSDLTYWEQKHYDVHQELTTALETIDIQRKENLELKQLIKGAELKEQNIIEQLGNFKTKFVDVHNKHQALLKAQEGVS